MGHRTLVHVSCLLVAVGFQWSAHNQPGKKEKTVKILREVFLPGKGWNLLRENGMGRVEGRRRGHMQTLRLRLLSSWGRDAGLST